MGYDNRHNTPETFAHRIHDALVEREEERVQEMASRGMDPTSTGEDVAAAARRRVEERHGRPGPGMQVRAEDLGELPDHITDRVADRNGRLLVLGGGSTIRVECPICPRHDQSWAVVDLRDIQEPVRSRIRDADTSAPGRAGGSPPGQLPPYACHACWTRWLRDGLFTKAEWILAHGGPPEIAQRLRGTPENRMA